ncbi:MAG: T9SS type A sorting domain-containing protein, partial [Calditrichaeota bacterium]|nr:T9SS type A sorting domain-containing protein [Calditrichota bacterium]
VYNLQGKLVHNLYGESPLSAGSHKLIWNAMGLTSGTYFLTIRSNGISETKSVELIK